VREVVRGGEGEKLQEGEEEGYGSHCMGEGGEGGEGRGCWNGGEELWEWRRSAEVYGRGGGGRREGCGGFLTSQIIIINYTADKIHGDFSI
jgi:hypothetical protein